MPRDSIATLPNFVSLSRLGLAAVFPFLAAAEERLLLIAAATATDFLDGFLARRQGAVTRLGAIIDPIADRGFMLVAVVTMWAEEVLSTLALIVLLARDVVVGAAYLLTRGSDRFRNYDFAARPAGKVATVLQLATLAVAYLAPPWLAAIVGALAVASAVALADYASAFWRRGVQAGAALAVLCGAATMDAQPIRFHPRIQAEANAGIVVSGPAVAVAGVSVNVPAGYYVRIAPAVAWGRAVGSDGAAVRAELAARFLTDPFRETRWGPYAGAGIAGDWRDGRRGRAAILLVAGTDLPFGKGWQPAIEVALGAGLRA